MKTRTSIAIALCGAITISGLCLMMGCSGSSSSPSPTTTSTSTSTAPMIVTASDAPLSNLLSASVTLSAATLSDGTNTVPALSQAVTVELSSLGAIQEPIDLTNVPFGNYTSVTLTVSSATVSYVNAAGQITTAAATIPQPTITVALPQQLNVNSQDEVHLALAYNLANCFSITGNTVTFAQAVNTTAAPISAESSADTMVEATGQVASVSKSSVTIQSGDSGRQFVFAINSSTQLPAGETLSNVSQGSIVRVQGQAQSDGSLLAVQLTPESAGPGAGGSGASGGSGSGSSGGSQQQGANGIVVSVVTGSSGQVTSFTMAPRQEYGGAPASTSLSVTLSSSTVYNVPEDAQQAGLGASAFSAAEIFPGQSVLVSGALDANGAMTAQQVALSPESISGTLGPVKQGSGSSQTFGLTLDLNSFLSTFAHITTLQVETSQATTYAGGLSNAGLATLPSGSAVELQGYLMMDASGHFTLSATQMAQSQTPETPENPSGH